MRQINKAAKLKMLNILRNGYFDDAEMIGLFVEMCRTMQEAEVKSMGAELGSKLGVAGLISRDTPEEAARFLREFMKDCEEPNDSTINDV